MYNTQDIAARIKTKLKTDKKSMKNMLIDLDMGINAISEFSKGKQLSCISLAKIADYLGCSVDYLMGRNNDISASILYNAYKSHPEHQVAINTLLGIKGLSTVPAEDNYKIAAFGGSSEEADEPEEVKTT